MSEELDSLAASPVERVSVLDTEQVDLSTRLAQVREVIAGMERLNSLTPSAVASLEKYRENEASLTLQLAQTETEIGKLLHEEPEAVLEFDRFHATDHAEGDATND